MKFINKNINLDKRNKQLMFQLFTEDFINSNRSIISDLFYGVNCNIFQCTNCNSISYEYQTYSFFDFPLEEIKLYKNQILNNNNNNNITNFNLNNNSNEINIYDCFGYKQNIIYLKHCEYCRQMADHWTERILVTGSEIITIILNRGNEKQFNIKINYFEDLNLSNFIEFKETGVFYRFIGLISYSRDKNMKKHFIAFCKSPIDSIWYIYDDSNVKMVKNFQLEIENTIPCVLLYQKKNFFI